MLNLAWSNAHADADLVRDGGNLHNDGGIYTALLLSIFLQRRAKEGDELPGDSKGGWWAEAFLDPEDVPGSRLWLLYRSTLTTETLGRARAYIEECVAWMLRDGVAKSIEVATWRSNDALCFRVSMTEPDGTFWTWAWEEVPWDAFV